MRFVTANLDGAVCADRLEVGRGGSEEEVINVEKAFGQDHKP
jgi:hypothetical protein